MPYNMEDVAEKIVKAVKSFTEREVARRVDGVELRLAQKMANAGDAQLFVKRVSKTVTELEYRVRELERINGTRGSD